MGQGAFRIPGTKPWGRNRAEYYAFFALNDQKPDSAVLDCAAGPSSFAAEMNRRGFDVIAADPIYAAAPGQIKAEIEDARRLMMQGLRDAAARFVWDGYGSPEALEATRLSTMKHFLEDFEEDRSGRYVGAMLPKLPFKNRAFDLALSSHFLFLYSAQFDLAFHLAAMRELCRVAGELRLFPLLDLDGRRSPHLEAVRRGLADWGWESELRRVGYEFQKGGNQMLWARPQDTA